MSKLSEIHSLSLESSYLLASKLSTFSVFETIYHRNRSKVFKLLQKAQVYYLFMAHSIKSSPEYRKAVVFLTLQNKEEQYLKCIFLGIKNLCKCLIIWDLFPVWESFWTLWKPEHLINKKSLKLIRGGKKSWWVHSCWKAKKGSFERCHTNWQQFFSRFGIDRYMN